MYKYNINVKRRIVCLSPSSIACPTSTTQNDDFSTEFIRAPSPPLSETTPNLNVMNMKTEENGTFFCFLSPPTQDPLLSSSPAPDCRRIPSNIFLWQITEIFTTNDPLYWPQDKSASICLCTGERMNKEGIACVLAKFRNECDECREWITLKPWGWR